MAWCNIIKVYCFVCWENCSPLKTEFVLGSKESHCDRKWFIMNLIKMSFYETLLKELAME